MAGFDHKRSTRSGRRTWDREQTFTTPTDRTQARSTTCSTCSRIRRATAARRPPEGLHGDRRRRAREADDGLQRAARDGLGQLRLARRAPRRAHRRASVVITARNIATFKRQLQKLGLSYDWTRELDDERSDYYKWTQWIFEVLFERGLAYRAEVPGQLLPGARHRARERRSPRRQVRRDRRSRREAADAPVDAKITEYADRLNDDLARARLAGRHAQGATRLDRQVDRRERRVRGHRWPERDHGVHDAARYAVRRHLGRARAGASARRRDHHARAARRGRRVSRPSRQAQRARSHVEAADAPKTGVPTGAFAVNPVNNEAHPDLDRRLRARELRHRRGVRVPRARRARLRVRDEVRPADHRGRARRRARRLHRRRHAHRERVSRRARQQRPRTTRSLALAREHGKLGERRFATSCATGCSRASATGASRFR